LQEVIIMLTNDDKKFALTTEDGDIIALYATEADARTDGTYLAEKDPEAKVQLRELTATRVDGGNLTKEFALKETYPLPEEEKKDEKKPAGAEAEKEEKAEARDDPGDSDKEEGGSDVACCPECGKPWAPAAEFCPECGCKPGEKKE